MRAHCSCGSPNVAARFGDVVVCAMCLTERWPMADRLARPLSGLAAPSRRSADGRSPERAAGESGVSDQPISTTALAALESRLGNENLFVTGRAGTGKTTLLRGYRARSGDNLIVLAPTGVAALNAGGSTIHSFFHFGKTAVRQEVLQRHPSDPGLYKGLTAIAIDEVSMVRADLLDCVDLFLRHHGPRPGEPFGGVVVTLIGDPYQLPPVVTRDDEDLVSGYESPYFFSSNAYREGGFGAVELHEVFRQHDGEFVDLLSRVREGKASTADLNTVNSRVERVNLIKRAEQGTMVLVTTNASRETINEEVLRRIPSEPHTYAARVEGRFMPSSRPDAPEVLRLKVGAKVMLLTNNRPHWVNGSIGYVSGFSRTQTVVWVDVNGSRVEVDPFTWEYTRYQSTGDGSIRKLTYAKFTQLPIKLAWASTIHKAQGLTLEDAILDVHRMFAPGQLYTALSRLRSLDALKLSRPVSPSDVIVDPHVQSFMATI